MENPKITCELCGGLAVGICIRCRRYVCDECMSEFFLCRDCYSFKKSIEEDRLRICSYVSKMTSVCEKVIRESSKCLRCIVLREMVLSLYKMVKDLSKEAQAEYFPEVLRAVGIVENKLRGLLIRLLVIQKGLKLPIEEFEEEESIT